MPILNILILLLLLILSFYGYGAYEYKQGERNKEAQYKQEIANLNEKARAKEHELQDKLTEIDALHYKELENAKEDNNKLKHDIITGDKRLYIRTKSCRAGNTKTKTALLDNEATQAELNAETASALISITNDGDEAIRQLNALQEYVQKVCK